MFRGKRTCYEGGVRIPLMLRWPGRVKPQVRKELVSTLDLMPTLLAAAGADPVPNLPGRRLQPLFDGAPTPWRTHLFSEYHTHGAQNFFPQRAVRNDRFKLIENLLPGEVHPDHAATLKKMAGEVQNSSPDVTVDFHAVIAAATAEVRDAYARMRQPPRFELYDLKNDPYELRNIADESNHAPTLKDLQHQLAEWREQTNDPLLKPENLRRLTREVRSVKSKKAAKKRAWRYLDYFFD